MRSLRIIISIYLALCLAVSGAIGLSPIFHLLVEHGGHGEAHSHSHSAVAPAHTHHPHAHAHDLNHQHKELSSHPPHYAYDHGLHGAVHTDEHHHNHGSVHLHDRLEHWLNQAWGVFHHLFPDPSNEPVENAEHHHHSLPQSMCGGLVEQALDYPQWILLPAIAVAAVFRFDELLLELRWNPESAGRAPPMLQPS